MYEYNPEIELYHHGIKGQKWGVRRFQNKDGSLTDEGRRHYGFGKGARHLISPNTKQRMKQGTKLGAKIGAGVGAGMSALVLPAMASAGLTNPVGLAAAGATYIATYAAAGAFDGLKYGTVVGAIETHAGRNYIKQYDEGLADFEMRDLKRKKPVNHGRNVSIVS